MKKFKEEFIRAMASKESQQKIAGKIFANSDIKDKSGNIVDMPADGNYYLHSKKSGKKIGWIKVDGGAGYGWCNLPAFMKMDTPKNIPNEFEGESFDEVDFEDYEDITSDYDVYEEDTLEDRIDFYDSLNQSADEKIEDEYIGSSDDNMWNAVGEYVDMKRQLNELQEKGEGFAQNRDMNSWKENKAMMSQIENDMHKKAAEFADAYYGEDIDFLADCILSKEKDAERETDLEL